ncbi:cell division protein FtsX, partial [Bartonella sp. AA86SXKL]|uniref:cell division protein FtsX n=1 Tax=Bartonella sp. AA86SXKL TaxID=3243441 RepID=UPI0035CEE209
FSIFTNNKKNTTAIIPSSNISGQALVAVIAIMTFLSSLTLIGVDLIQRSAKNWSNQISYEATIQIRPIENVDTEKALRDAVKLVKTFHGVQDATIVDQKATEKLLEPWLGTGLNLNELPLPRLIIVTLKEEE